VPHLSRFLKGGTLLEATDPTRLLLKNSPILAALACSPSAWSCGDGALPALPNPQDWGDRHGVGVDRAGSGADYGWN